MTQIARYTIYNAQNPQQYQRTVFTFSQVYRDQLIIFNDSKTLDIWMQSSHYFWITLIEQLSILSTYNPLGNVNSGRSPRAKLIRSASLQLVFNAAISKLLWRLVSRCFYMSICVFSTIRLKWLVQFECLVMRQNVYRQSPDSDREMFLNIMLAVFRILDKLHIFSNILCTCGIFIKMWAQI